MTQKTEYYVNRMNYLLAYHRQSHVKMDAMDAMDHMIWSPTWPGGMIQPTWWRNFPTPKLKNDLNSGTTMFSKVAPQFKLVPLVDNQQMRDHANKIEKALQWQYYLSCKKITKGVVRNALKFDHVSIQIVYNKEQSKINKLIETNRWDAPGDFTFILHKPTTVYPVHSSLGLESQLVVKKTSVQDVQAVWGMGNSKLNALEDKEGSGRAFVYLFDWTDHVDRVVLCFPTSDGSAASTLANMPVGLGSPIEVFKDAHNLPFIPWVDVIGSADNDELPEDQHRPLLDTAYEGDQYNNANIIRSAMRSLVLASLTKIAAVTKTQDGEPPEIDRSQALPEVNLEINESYEQLPSPQIDSRLAQLVAEDDAEMGGGTIPGVLADPRIQSGVAFASINHQYDVAESKLDPHITVAEDALAEAAKIMLRFYIHTGDPLTGYAFKQKKAKSKGSIDLQPDYSGGKIEVPSDEIPTDVARGDAIYLTAKLTASHPIDQTAKLNGGLLMKQIGYPQEEIFEALDEANPQELIKKLFVEMFTNAAVQKRLKPLMAEGDAAAQTVVGRAQMKLQQEMMAAQQPQAPQQPMPPDMQPPDPSQVPGPANGGMSPGQLAPGQMEQQAMAKAVGSDPSMSDPLAAITAAATGQRGGELSAMLGPGATTRESVRKAKGKK